MSLLESSIALSLIALFAAIFVSLSARLAQAQHQQQSRATAISVLEASFHDLKETPANLWLGPWQKQVEENGLTFHVMISLDAGKSSTDEGFGVFQGSVSWKSKTGLRKIEREVWVHERLN